MKGQVPRREPGVFPLVRHGKDGTAVEVLPFRIAARLALAGWSGGIGIPLEPAAHVVFVILLVPYHSGKSLPLDQASIFVLQAGLNPKVEVITIAFSRAGDIIEIGKGCWILS